MSQTSKEEKKKKKSSPVFWVILIIAICVFIFAGYNLLKIGLRYKEAADSYEKVGQMLETNPSYDDTAYEFGEDPKSSSHDPDMVPFIWDYEKMLSINPDTKGWIYEKDLLNYPIVQTTDNDYYLHTTFDGTYNPSGCIFIDWQMPEGLNGLYCIVYGHNMNDGSMFGCLQKYHQDTSFYIKHPKMHIFNGDKHYIYNVVAAYTTPIDGFTYTDALNNADVSDYIEKARNESVYEMYKGDITDDTNIVVLSTCTEASDEAYRFVVILSRDHEVR